MKEVGDKYIVEISEKYETVEDWDVPNEEQRNAPCMLYRIKGFNSLVFDETGLNKLEKYDADQRYLEGKSDGLKLMGNEYQCGLNDAWEALKKIVNLNGAVQKTLFEVDNPYPSKQIADILETYTASEAIVKIKAYEEQKKVDEEDADNIKVGDEVIPVADVEVLNPSKGVVVCEIAIGKNLRVMWDDGSSGCWEKDRLQKTGKHFDCIAEVLKQLQEGE